MLLLDNEKKTSVSEAPHEKPPHAVLFEMLFGAWTAKILAEVVRLDVPDALAHGPLTADELVRKAGIRAHPVALHRALRACAALGIVTEDSAGRFGPTRLSALLTRDTPGHAEALRRVLGRLAMENLDGLAGRARDRRFASALAARPGLLRLPGRESASARGVRRDAEGSQRRREQGRDGALRLRRAFGRSSTSVRATGHSTVAVLEKYPGRSRCRVRLCPRSSPRRRRSSPCTNESVARRLTYAAGDMFKDVPAGATPTC